MRGSIGSSVGAVASGVTYTGVSIPDGWLADPFEIQNTGCRPIAGNVVERAPRRYMTAWVRDATRIKIGPVALLGLHHLHISLEQVWIAKPQNYFYRQEVLPV